MAPVQVRELSGDQLRENFWLCQMIRLDGATGSTSLRIAGNPGSNSGPGENFCLKLIRWLVWKPNFRYSLNTFWRHFKTLMGGGIKWVKIYFIRLMSPSFLVKILCYTFRPFANKLTLSACTRAGRCLILKWL